MATLTVKNHVKAIHIICARESGRHAATGEVGVISIRVEDAEMTFGRGTAERLLIRPFDAETSEAYK